MKGSLDTSRSKSGANGHALSTSIVEANSLPESLIRSIETLGGKDISDAIQYLRLGTRTLKHDLLYRLFTVPGKYSFRRLSCFVDKEMKVRVVGILDLVKYL